MPRASGVTHCTQVVVIGRFRQGTTAGQARANALARVQAIGAHDHHAAGAAGHENEAGKRGRGVSCTRKEQNEGDELKGQRSDGNSEHHQADASQKRERVSPGTAAAELL